VPERGPDLVTDINFAEAWEAIARAVPNRVALICRDQSISYSQLEARANQLAHWMSGQGIGPGDHVGVYMQNCFEYIEVTLATFKLRAVPININFRYVADELVYLFNDADLVGVVHHPEFADTLRIVSPSCPLLRWSLAIGPDYEQALSGQSGQRDFPPRSGDDHYLIYTGGTTGMPKGVVWRQDDAFYACLGLHDPTLPPITSVADLVERVSPSPSVYLVLAPLMHAAGGWVAMTHALKGNTVLLWTGPLDGSSVWRTVAKHKVEATAVVGDAVMRPLLDGWDQISEKPDISSLKSVASGGAPLAPALRERFLSTFTSVAA
jgi:acyl-CoA synthetase (AMP-forming)/AMP-acid ligase II